MSRYNYACPCGVGKIGKDVYVGETYWSHNSACMGCGSREHHFQPPEPPQPDPVTAPRKLTTKERLTGFIE